MLQLLPGRDSLSKVSAKFLWARFSLRSSMFSVEGLVPVPFASGKLPYLFGVLGLVPAVFSVNCGLDGSVLAGMVCPASAPTPPPTPTSQPGPSVLMVV